MVWSIDSSSLSLDYTCCAKTILSSAYIPIISVENIVHDERVTTADEIFYLKLRNTNTRIIYSSVMLHNVIDKSTDLNFKEHLCRNSTK